MNKELMNLLFKLEDGKLCTESCYGCCGDEQISLSCNDILTNFEEELKKIGYRKEETCKNEWDNFSDGFICSECGERLDNYCDECGSNVHITTSFKYCPNCGRKIER